MYFIQKIKQLLYTTYSSTLSSAMAKRKKIFSIFFQIKKIEKKEKCIKIYRYLVLFHFHLRHVDRFQLRCDTPRTECTV